MSYSLTWIPDVLRSAGLKVIEQPGWQTRGHGDVDTIKGVICHHTAGARSGNAPDLGIVTNGRPEAPGVSALAGPLAQLVLGRDGTFYAIAAGKAYHAGAGYWQGMHDGNGEMIGIEAENTGLSNDNPWDSTEVDAYIRGVAALLAHIKAQPIMCCGHLEYALPAGRKSDPSFSVGTRDDRVKAMVAFRAKVAAAMNVHAPQPQDHLTVGHDAKWLQASLNSLVLIVPRLDVDGYVGRKTIAAIRLFQKQSQLPVTGKADYATLAAVEKALGHHEACGCSAIAVDNCR